MARSHLASFAIAVGLSYLALVTRIWLRQLPCSTSLMTSARLQRISTELAKRAHLLSCTST